jgi:antitoxin MazE
MSSGMVGFSLGLRCSLSQPKCIVIVDTLPSQFGVLPLVIHFSKWGNSLALRIPAAYAREIGACENGSAELTIENGALVVSPVKESPEFDLDALVAQITDDNRHEEIVTGPALGHEFS